uniref:WD repeat-containing protein on Y chromosome n=1 Tax=Monopterus albus TaxID=43700 RepID=A0A3Q3JWI7_MONAL
MAEEKMDNRYFPKPFEFVPVNHHKNILRLLFRPSDDKDHSSECFPGETRTYQRGQYLSISSDGVFSCWSESFDMKHTVQLDRMSNTLPFSHNKKIRVTDMVYLRELQEVAIFFTCVEFFPSTGCLVTGGTDGSLRVWFPHKISYCVHVLKGHVTPVTHIMYNHLDKVLISLSEDKNVRVWSEGDRQCRQSFQADGMTQAPVSCVCYNTHNNELFLANTAVIGKCLGRGTDVFQSMLRSHKKPLCSALYNSIFKQVVSVCQNGVVTVWDILTGKAVLQFKVTPDQHVGLTAMTFDEPQRRLITISQDGKVRLWNFHNGTQLAVLSNRLFVSGRNSKDISSMDVHNNLLVAASSNGTIVIWNADTAKALCCLNTSMSPETQMTAKAAQGQRSLPVERTSRHALMFLNFTLQTFSSHGKHKMSTANYELICGKDNSFKCMLYVMQQMI